MIKTDIDFCAELLANVGEQLLVEFTTGVHSRNLTDMIGRFHQANGTASKKIETALSLKFPEIRWLDAEFKNSEFDGMHEGSYWLCDPLDGALNFLQGIPFWSLSLCFIQNGQPEMSMVFDPCRNELFYACKGQGAFLNGNEIRVSETTDVSDSILAGAHPTFVRQYRDDTIQTGRDVYNILPKAQAVRMMGTVSLQLAYVASGRFDGYWEHGSDMYDWWSGALLVQQAGGVVMDTSNLPFTWGARGIIATNPSLSPQLKTEVGSP